MDSLASYARECLFQSFQNLIPQYDGETKTAVISQIAHISQISLTSLFIKRNLADVRDGIFTVAKVRDFMLAMTTNFFYRFGDDEAMFNNLVNNLVNATLMVDPRLKEDTLLPEVVSQRLPSKEEIDDALTANKWLIVLVLINLNLSVRELTRLQSSTSVAS